MPRLLPSLVCLHVLCGYVAGCVDDIDERTAVSESPPTATPDITTEPLPPQLPPVPPPPPPPPPPLPDDEFPFISEWEVTNIGGELKIVLPLPEGFKYDFVVDWGDDQQTSVRAFDDRGATHVYRQAGRYIVKISGVMEAWSFQQLPHSRDQLLAVTDLGSVAWRDLRGAFEECDNLISVGAGKSEFTRGVESMANMFAGADLVNPDVSNWDTSAVSDLSGMFANTRLTNPDVSDWETSSVTDMTAMFEDATGIEDLRVDGWNTGQVTSMERMFANAGFSGSMDKPPYLVDWDFSKVTTMAGMLRGQTLPTASYSNMLDKIAEGSVMMNVYFDAGGSTYNTVGANAKHRLKGESGWTIYDGGADID